MKKWWITALLLAVSVNVQALTFTLSEKHVNEMAKLAFPQTQYFNDIKLVFSNPKVQLGSLEDNLAVMVTINAERDGQTLEARGKMVGLLRYRPERKELQIEKPMLVDFDVTDNKMDDATPLLNAINQMQGRQFPMILLIDFAELNLGLFGNQMPKRIDITNKHLVIEI